jgi:hypothetical protein
VLQVLTRRLLDLIFGNKIRHQLALSNHFEQSPNQLVGTTRLVHRQRYGRGAGVGRDLGLGRDLGVGVALGVVVGVGVGVADGGG